MKNVTLQISVALLTTLCGAAYANMETAQKNNCMACHGVANKVLGPSYQDVAKKYADSKDALATLTASIKKGGGGKWGPMPMPAQTNLSDTDAQTLAKWILSSNK